jgi:CheY-like chemotaxis protein
MMDVLLIEDDQQFVDAFTEEVDLRAIEASLLAVASRDAAIVAIDGNDFDLIVCDLSIPTVDGALDEDIEHGLRIRAYAAERSPGTPVLIFSAKGQVQHIKPLVGESGPQDVFGDGDSCPMLQYFEKDELEEVLRLVDDYARRLVELDRIELASGGRDLSLTPKQMRVLRLLTRRGGGHIAHVGSVRGGLSRSKVVKVRSEREGGGSGGLFVAKIGLVREVRDERKRYQSHAAGILPHGSYTILADEVSAGASDVGGIAYALLEGFDRTMFEVAALSDEEAAEVVGRLQQNLRTWSDDVPAITTTVREIRRGVLEDARFEEVLQFLPGEIAGTENVEVFTRVCPQHGDLHGGNVLVDHGGIPVIIDFGSCTTTCASFDAVALEASVLFHPDAAGNRDGWDLQAIVERWVDRDEVGRLTGRPLFVSACRDWAYAVAGGDREVLAATYSYALVQLGHPDVDRNAAASLAVGAATQLSA